MEKKTKLNSDNIFVPAMQNLCRAIVVQSLKDYIAASTIAENSSIETEAFKAGKHRATIKHDMNDKYFKTLMEIAESGFDLKRTVDEIDRKTKNHIAINTVGITAYDD